MATLVRHSGIAVGVNGSTPSRVAAVWAAREASMRNVALTLVHLVPTRSGDLGGASVVCRQHPN